MDKYKRQTSPSLLLAIIIILYIYVRSNIAAQETFKYLYEEQYEDSSCSNLLYYKYYHTQVCLPNNNIENGSNINTTTVGRGAIYVECTENGYVVYSCEDITCQDCRITQQNEASYECGIGNGGFGTGARIKCLNTIENPTTSGIEQMIYLNQSDCENDYNIMIYAAISTGKCIYGGNFNYYYIEKCLSDRYAIYDREMCPDMSCDNSTCLVHNTVIAGECMIHNSNDRFIQKLECYDEGPLSPLPSESSSLRKSSPTLLGIKEILFFIQFT